MTDYTWFDAVVEGELERGWWAVARRRLGVTETVVILVSRREAHRLARDLGRASPADGGWRYVSASERMLCRPDIPDPSAKPEVDPAVERDRWHQPGRRLTHAERQEALRAGLRAGSVKLAR